VTLYFLLLEIENGKQPFFKESRKEESIGNCSFFFIGLKNCKRKEKIWKCKSKLLHHFFEVNKTKF
jgi:hypothetical protein